MNKHKNLGLTLALIAPLAFSCFNIGLRFLAGDISIWMLLFLRGLIGVSVILLVAGLLKKKLWGPHKNLLMLIGFIGFLSTACTTTAITLIPLYQAMVILYLYPAAAILLARVINKEKAGGRDGLAVGLAIGGCVLLIWPDQSAGLHFQRGHLIGLSGSLLYSLGYVLTRRLGNDNCGLEPIFHYSLFAALGSLPLGWILGAGLQMPSISLIYAGLFLGALGSLAQLMSYAAVRWLPAHKVGALGTLEVLGGMLASWLIFNDPITIRGLGGGLIIMLAVFILRRNQLQSGSESDKCS